MKRKVYTNPDLAMADAGIFSFQRGHPYNVWRWSRGRYTVHLDGDDPLEGADLYGKCNGFERELA